MTAVAIASRDSLSSDRWRSLEKSEVVTDVREIIPTTKPDHVDQQRDQDSHQSSTTKSGPLISASLITQDFDALRFEAAASLQLFPVLNTISSHPLLPSIPKAHALISSPYNDPDHLLDIRSLDTQNRLFAQALSFLRPIRPDYATADYMVSFNWPEVLSILRAFAASEQHVWTAQSFYTVIFRSHLNRNINEQWLHGLDKNSHREAVVSGGLLKYWFGARDDEERNLATCIWRSKEDARLGGLGPEHKKARLAARELYQSIRFSAWRLVVQDGAADVRLEPWTDDQAA